MLNAYGIPNSLFIVKYPLGFLNLNTAILNKFMWDKPITGMKHFPSTVFLIKKTKKSVSVDLFLVFRTSTSSLSLQHISIAESDVDSETGRQFFFKIIKFLNSNSTC
jgi:hypothetical protein